MAGSAAPSGALAVCAPVGDMSVGTPAEILVLQEIIERKTNTYIYDTLKRKQEAAGDGAAALAPLPVMLDSLSALFDDDEHDDGAALQPMPSCHPPPGTPRHQRRERSARRRGKAPDDAAAEEYAARRAARETWHKEEETRSQQYLLELRIREQIAQAQQQQQAAAAAQELAAAQEHAQYYQPPDTAVASSAAVGYQQTEEARWYAQAAASPASVLAATHPTAVSFLQSSVEPLQYVEPYLHGGKGGGKGARKGHYGKGSGKGYYNGQEICKEYARNNKRCTYAARTGNPRGCKFYHGSDEEMRAAAARLGWDNRRYDGYEALCVLLWERQHGTAWDAAAVSARGLYASAEQ